MHHHNEFYLRTYKDKKGVKLIAYELKLKGVDGDIISTALSEFEESENPAIAIAQKFCVGKEVTKELVQKLYRKLLSKGFTYDDANYAIDRLKEN